MTDPQEQKELAALKQSLGAPLTEKERALLLRLRGTPEEEELGARTAATRRLLEQVSELRPPAVDTRGMVERLEQRMRSQAVEFRKRFVPFCAVVFGLAAVAGAVPLVIPHPRHGMPEIRQLWLLLFLGACAICSMMYWHNRRVLRSDDLYGFLMRHERRSRRTPLEVVGGVLAIAVVFLLEWSRSGTVRAAAFVGGLLVVLSLAALFLRRSLRRTRLSQDAELWGWWYGEQR